MQLGKSGRGWLIWKITMPSVTLKLQSHKGLAEFRSTSAKIPVKSNKAIVEKINRMSTYLIKTLVGHERSVYSFSSDKDRQNVRWQNDPGFLVTF